MQADYRVTLYDVVTPPQATTKFNRIAERRNGRRNGQMAGMATYLLHLWYMPTPTPTPFNLLR